MQELAATAAPAEVDAVADRRVHRRRPAAYVAWLVLGGIGTHVDKIHEHFGVVAYPNPSWIGERLPVSPVYLAAAVGFFVLYTVVVGHRGRAQGLFGGRPLSAKDFLFAFCSWIAAYTLTGWLGSLGGIWPFVAAGILMVWAAPDLWAARRTWMPLFAALVATLGVGFEWTATAGGAFAYPVCPAPECLGTTVPALWLLALYVHAALYVHRMLGGRYLFDGRAARWRWKHPNA